MGKTHSNPLVARHGMAGERHAMCVNWPLLYLEENKERGEITILKMAEALTNSIVKIPS
jgi:hypothetical protein